MCEVLHNFCELSGSFARGRPCLAYNIYNIYNYFKLWQVPALQESFAHICLARLSLTQDLLHHMTPPEGRSPTFSWSDIEFGQAFTVFHLIECHSKTSVTFNHGIMRWRIAPYWFRICPVRLKCIDDIWWFPSTDVLSTNLYNQEMNFSPYPLRCQGFRSCRRCMAMFTLRSASTWIIQLAPQIKMHKLRWGSGSIMTRDNDNDHQDEDDDDDDDGDDDLMNDTDISDILLGWTCWRITRWSHAHHRERAFPGIVVCMLLSILTIRSKYQLPSFTMYHVYLCMTHAGYMHGTCINLIDVSV